MFNKIELIGIASSIMLMAVALYMVRLETTTRALDEAANQPAAVAESGIVVVADDGTGSRALRDALLDAADTRGNLERMIIDDVQLGSGEAVVEGDTVRVHYIGTLQNGTEFDNSRKRGQSFEFTVGKGRVIPGWDQGLVGMKVGGQRILVIPPDMAYGEAGVGPIPPNATLVFAIELLEIVE